MDLARTEHLFHQARGLPPDERAAFLARECDGDQELERQVREILAQSESPDSSDSWETDLVLQSADGEGGILEPMRAARAESGDPTTLVGQSIGGHRVERLLAVGGMGSVFEAIQPITNRRVALKILRPELLGKDLVRRFSVEIEVLGRLHHPNIAEIFEGGSEVLFSTEIPYFTMELVPHATQLHHYVRDRKLGIEASLDLFEAICRALGHAHVQGVIHRDLKPENIIIDGETAGAQPKVIDFGIARFSQDGRPRTQLTSAGQIIGTLETMSPEQARGGSAEIDERTDVYALGVVLFIMLTQQPPIPVRGLSIPEALRAVMENPPRPPSSHRPEIAKDLDAIALKALSKEPSHRYDSVGALLEDIRAFRRGDTIRARTPGAWDVLRLTVRRHHTLLVSTALVFAVALAAAAVSVRFALRASERAEDVRRVAYQTSMNAASSAFAQADDANARRFLEDAPASFRGWEWHYLAQRLAPAGKEIGPPLSIDWHRGFVFSPDGRYYATTEDGESTVKIWLADTGSELRTFAAQGEIVWIGFDASAGVLAQTWQPQGGTFHRWSIDGRESDTWDIPPEFQYDTTYRFGAYTAADGGRLAINVDGTIRIYDFRVRQVTARHRLGGPPMCSAFDASGRRLAAAHRPSEGDYAVTLFEEGVPVRVLTGPGDTIEELVFTADRRRLIAASTDGGVYVWNLERDDPTAERVLGKGNDAVRFVTASEDSRHLAASGADAKIRRWNLETGDLLGTIDLNTVLLGGLDFRPGTRTLYGVSAHSPMQTWDLPDDDPTLLARHESYVYPIELSARSGTVISGGWDGYVNRPGCLRWTDLETGMPVAELGPPGASVLDAALLPDESELIVSVYWAGPDDSIQAEALDEASALLFAPQLAGLLVRISNLSGQVLARNQLTYPIYSLAVSPDQTRIVSGDGIGTLRVHDRESLGILHEDPYFKLGVGHTPVAWSPDGRWIAVTVNDRSIQIWDAETYAVQSELQHSSAVWSLVFSDDSRRLLSTSDDQTTNVWSVPAGEQLASLEGYGTTVLRAKFHPREDRIVAAGRGGTAAFWTDGTYQSLATLSLHDSYIYDLEWSADGQTLVTSSGDGTVRVWNSRGGRDREEQTKRRDELVRRWRVPVESALAAGERPEDVWTSLAEGTGATPRESQIIWQEVLRASLLRQRVMAP